MILISIMTTTSMTKENKETKIKNNFGLNVEEMAEAGLHLGHLPSKTHPKMRPYIFGLRSGIHIIDLEKSIEKLKEALEFVKKTILEKKQLILIGTRVQEKELVKEIAREANVPYINERWLGGTFTNFETIKKRIEYFKELKEKKERGEFEKYTKKERAKIDKELAELEARFGGIKKLEKLPDVVFLTNLKKDKLVVKEAKKKKIPVIAICDTDADPSLVDYPIPANDDAVPSIKYILEKLKNVILQTRSLIPDQESEKTDRNKE